MNGIITIVVWLKLNLKRYSTCNAASIHCFFLWIYSTLEGIQLCQEGSESLEIFLVKWKAMYSCFFSFCLWVESAICSSVDCLCNVRYVLFLEFIFKYPSCFVDRNSKGCLFNFLFDFYNRSSIQRRTYDIFH